MSEPITPYQQADLRVKRHDLLLKVVTAFVAVAGACLACLGFALQAHQAEEKREADRKAELQLKAKDTEQREKEYKLQFYHRQADVYFELCDTASRIALARRRSQIAKELTRFHELLLGRLEVIADAEVYLAVQRFNEALANQRDIDVISDNLQPLARDMARACRVSLRGAFPNIGELPPAQGAVGDLRPPEK